MRFILVQFGLTFAWALVGAVSMALGLGLAVGIFNLMTPGLDEMAELKKGNLAVAIILASFILATAIVIAIAIMPG